MPPLCATYLCPVLNQVAAKQTTHRVAASVVADNVSVSSLYVFHLLG